MSEQAQAGTQEQSAGTSAAQAAAAANAGDQNQNNQQQGGAQQQNTNGAANGANGGGQQTIAAGGQQQQQEQAKPYWPEDWREKMAEHLSAGDKKAMEKELRRLKNLDSPFAVAGSWRNIENAWARGDFVRLPGEDAKPEDIAKYHKAIGVPEKPEGYLKDFKLANGAVLGEADLPVVQDFAAYAHKAGAPAGSVHAALNWYFEQQEKQAAALDEADDKHRRESEQALKNDFGASLARKTNALAALFVNAPGGADAKNPKSMFSRIMSGRTADGKIIGNDPDVIRWMVSLNQDVNPAASIVEDGDQGGASVETEIANIEKVMREDRRAYNKNTVMQNRYRELLDARNRIQARKTA